MQAYNKADLYNKYIKEQVAEAFENKCIDDITYKAIVQAYPCNLYTPNYFIRIALGLLTLVAVICSGLFLWLLAGSSTSGGLTAIFLLLAVFCYIALEFFAAGRRFYNAGVDNVLMAQVVISIVCAVFAAGSESYLLISGIVMFISLFLCLRFTDAFMAMVSYCALFVFVFLACTNAGGFAKASAPFVMMAVSALSYFVGKKLIAKQGFIYCHSLKTVLLLTLLTFYASGNYFVITGISSKMFHSSPAPVRLAWVFWLFTATIPPGYLLYGIYKKDLLFIRTGLFLIAISVFTVRYYYPFASAEIIMLVAGAVLVVVSLILIKYLAAGRYGFSFTPASRNRAMPEIESLVIAQTFGQKHPASEDSSLFKGGSGGGAGATGEY